MFENLFTDLSAVSAFDVAVNLALALVLGMLVAVIYRVTYSGYSYSSSLVSSMVILTMITAVVIMVIGNNLARAFGLVGAMSIIRFRTAVKDTRDIVFIFFALAVGMAIGSGNHLVGILGAGTVCLVILVLYLADFGSVNGDELLLRFTMVPGDNDGDSQIYMPIFEKYLKNFELLNIKSVRMGQYLEYSFNIFLKEPDKYNQVINELNAVEGIERVGLIFKGYESETS